MEDTYVPEPTMVQVVLAELKKIPDKVLELSAGNYTPEELMVQAIGEALVIVERFMDITYQESDLLPPEGHTGPEVALVKVAYTEKADNLAQQYWDHVSN
jgi:hypothetical protein